MYYFTTSSYYFRYFCYWGNPHGHPPLDSSGQRWGSVGLYLLNLYGGPPDAQLECPGTSFEILREHSLCLLLSEGVVPWLVRALGGIIPLNAIPPWRVGPYDHLGRRRVVLRRGTLPLTLSCSVRSFTSFTLSQYERTARNSCCPLNIAFTTEEGSNLPPKRSGKFRRKVIVPYHLYMFHPCLRE